MNDFNFYTEDDAELLVMAQTVFVQRNQNIWNEINEAIDSGDIELAHRLVHTLKGSAALCELTQLQQSAATVEAMLKMGAAAIPCEMANALSDEISAGLARFAHLLTKPEQSEQTMDEGEVVALLGRLEAMLKNFNPDCFDLVDQLRSIPGMDELSYQINDYDLKAAIKTLAGLKEKWPASARGAADERPTDGTDNPEQNAVLIVDDEASNIKVLARILRSEYRLYAASNGPDAIDAVKAFSPDVILLDVIMPGVDGYCVISALSETQNAKDIPIIFISGLGSSADEEKGLDLGAVDYIAKPFSPAIVRHRVRNQIKIRNMQKELDASRLALKELGYTNTDHRG